MNYMCCNNIIIRWWDSFYLLLSLILKIYSVQLIWWYWDRGVLYESLVEASMFQAHVSMIIHTVQNVYWMMENIAQKWIFGAQDMSYFEIILTMMIFIFLICRLKNRRTLPVEVLFFENNRQELETKQKKCYRYPGVQKLPHKLAFYQRYIFIKFHKLKKPKNTTKLTSISFLYAILLF